MHILPARFVKIRHYGLLANRGRDGRIERARQLIGAPPAETPPAQAETPTEAANVKPQLTCENQRGQALRIDMTRNHLNFCCQNVNRQGLTPLIEKLLGSPTSACPKASVFCIRRFFPCPDTQGLGQNSE